MTNHLAFDSETTGLYAYLGDRPFAFSIADEGTEEYIIGGMKEVPETDGYIFIHNAKFDMHMLSVKNIPIPPRIFCTQAISRLLSNLQPSYSLDYLGKHIGFPKDDTVKKYISKNKLYTTTVVSGKKKVDRKPHYDQVPHEIMCEYAKRDARVAYELGVHLIDKLLKRERDKPKEDPSAIPLLKNELALTYVLFEMEKLGIKVDVAYCQAAIDNCTRQVKIQGDLYHELVHKEFVDSNKAIKETFEEHGITGGTTAKGNPSFSASVLETMDNKIAKCILDHRKVYKKLNTYYRNFLDLKDDDGLLHCNFVQGGTSTGRMSCREPNLQNVHKENNPDEDFNPRACFIPRDGYNFFMLDYDQMEYRLMLDIAGETKLIKKIIGGMDVHAATAEAMGVERKYAKTINFMLLYGGGAQKLADALGIDLEKAEKLKNLYFEKLPMVSSFICDTIGTAKLLGHITNWFGRRCFVEEDKEYKAPNYLIQGGCGDIVKKAMVQLADYLADKKSNMVLQIHDEILFEVHKDEEHIVEQLQTIMEQAYPHLRLPMTVGVEWSDTNWAERKPYSKSAD